MVWEGMVGWGWWMSRALGGCQSGGRDLMGLEVGIGINWFKEGVMRKVWNGGKTSFWLDKWVGNAPLCEVFPRLFSLSLINIYMLIQKKNMYNEIMYQRRRDMVS